MAKEKKERVSLRVSSSDKKMVQAVAEQLNISQSDVWRMALKQLHDRVVKEVIKDD